MNGGYVCDGTAFEMKPCKIKVCRNSNLLKSKKTVIKQFVLFLVNNFVIVFVYQPKFTPYITITEPTIENTEDPQDYEYYDDINEEYTNSHSAKYVQPPPYPEALRLDNKPQKVTIRVENYIPITKDISQISLNLQNGLGAVTL